MGGQVEDRLRDIFGETDPTQWQARSNVRDERILICLARETGSTQ